MAKPTENNEPEGTLASTMPEIFSGGWDEVLSPWHTRLNLTQHGTKVYEAVGELSEKQRHQWLI